MGDIVLLDFGGEGRPGADQAHVAAQHIPELRHFVQRVFAEQAAHAGDARIVRHLEQDAVAFVQMVHGIAQRIGIGHHGAELEAVKLMAFAADPLAAIKEWAGGVEPDGEGHNQQQRREHQQCHAGDQDVEHPLEHKGAHRELPPVQRNGWELADILHGGVPGEAVIQIGDDAHVDA